MADKELHELSQVEPASDDSGMTPHDAAASAYDDHDRAHHGIAEGEREEVGGYLKHHADAANVTVRDGLVHLVETNNALMHGDQNQKRAIVGDLIDNNNVRAEPTYGEAVAAQPYATIEQASGAVDNFMAQNPAASDPTIYASMVAIAQDMTQRGFQPDLATAFQHAVQGDPRYQAEASRSQRIAKEDAKVARAKAASVQVSGAGNSGGSVTSEEISDIVSDQLGNWGR